MKVATCLMAVAAGLSSGCGDDTVELPPVDLSGAAPGLAERLQAAQKILSQEPEDAERWGAVGIVLDINGLQNAAVPYYARAQELAPDDWRWPYFQGICLRISDLNAATQQLLRAKDLKPDYLPVLVACGRALDQVDRRDEARKVFQRAVQTDPRCAPALEGLAALLLASDRTDQAESLLQRATAAAPYYAPAWRLLAQVQQRLRKPKDAERSRRFASVGNDDLPVQDPVRAELARSHGVLVEHSVSRERAALASGSQSAAIRQWQEHLERDPESSVAHQRLCRLHVLAGDTESARHHLDKARALDPDSGEPDLNYGIALVSRGRMEDAEPPLRAALASDPELHRARVHLGSLLCATGRGAEGVPLLRQAVGEDPFDADARYNLAVAQVEGGASGEAVANFAVLSQLAPTHDRVFDRWASVLQQSGKDSDALSVLRSGLEASPNNLFTINQLAWLLSTARDPGVRDGTKAVAAATRLTRTEPRSPVFFDTLAAAHAEAGQFEQAVKAAEHAMSLASAAPSGSGAAQLAERIRSRLDSCYRADRPWRGLP